MTKPTDDLSQDPFNTDDLPENQTFTENMRDVAFDKAKETAGNYAREAPKRMGKRFLWNMILSVTFVGEFQKERLLNRIERGEKVTLHEILFGTKFSLFGLIRMLIFFALVAGFGYYFWANGSFDMIAEQQALLNQIQATPTP